MMKKSLVSLVLVLTLVCGCFAMAQAMPSDHDVSYYYVSTSNRGPLNMRQDKSTNSDVLARIPYGTQIMVYDYAPGDKWVLCIYNENEGYVMTRYLSGNKPSGRTPSSTTNPTAGSEAAEYKRMEAAYYYAVVHPSTPTGYVHMRWAPSKSEPTQHDYYDGQVLKVLYQDSKWCQVYDETLGISGWMMRAFLTYAGEAEATSYSTGTIMTANGAAQ